MGSLEWGHRGDPPLPLGLYPHFEPRSTRLKKANSYIPAFFLFRFQKGSFIENVAASDTTDILLLAWDAGTMIG